MGYARCRRTSPERVTFGVITIAGEFGRGVGAIARSVAERLGWKLLDKNLAETVAQAAQVDLENARRYDEDVDSCWHRINRAGLWPAALAGGATALDAQSSPCHLHPEILRVQLEGPRSLSHDDRSLAATALYV